MRQGSWMIEDLLFHPFPDLVNAYADLDASFDHVIWCCYAEILQLEITFVALSYVTLVLHQASFLLLRLQYLCLL